MEYFQRIYGKIESDEPRADILLKGCLYSHMGTCQQQDCPCDKIARSYLRYVEKRRMLDRFHIEEETLMGNHKIMNGEESTVYGMDQSGILTQQ